MRKRRPKYYVYILRCSDGSYYVGFTHDLFTRVKYHYRGEGAMYTRKRMPVELVFYREFSDNMMLLSLKSKLKVGLEQRKEHSLIVTLNCFGFCLRTQPIKKSV